MILLGFFLVAIASLDHPKGSGAACLEMQEEKPSYYTRLGSLSTKLCSRAYYHSLAKLRMIKLGAQQALFQLEQIFYLVRNSVIPCYVWEIKERMTNRTLEERQHPCWNM